MNETIIIPRRFSGPPGVGNGGYCCGRFAALLGGEAEVTLRRPISLETPLEIARDGESLRVLDGGQLAAEIVAADLSQIDAPEMVTLEQAIVGASRFPFTDHPFPTCFVCGPRREQLDGLRIHAYTVPEGDCVASPWVPSPSLANEEGTIPPEIIWAALDCPTGWAGLATRPGTAAVLGRLAVRIDRPVRADRAHVVVARATGAEGRKLRAVAGIYAADGTLCASSRATWVEVRTDQPPE